MQKVLYFFYEGNDLNNLELELRDPFLKKYYHNKFHYIFNHYDK